MTVTENLCATKQKQQQKSYQWRWDHMTSHRHLHVYTAVVFSRHVPVGWLIRPQHPSNRGKNKLYDSHCWTFFYFDESQFFCFVFVFLCRGQEVKANHLFPSNLTRLWIWRLRCAHQRFFLFRWTGWGSLPCDSIRREWVWQVKTRNTHKNFLLQYLMKRMKKKVELWGISLSQKWTRLLSYSLSLSLLMNDCLCVTSRQFWSLSLSFSFSAIIIFRCIFEDADRKAIYK